MKANKYIFTTLFLFFVSATYSQNIENSISSSNSVTETIGLIEFIAHRDYPNNKRIAYFYIIGIENNEEAIFLQEELKKKEIVKRFFVYQKEENKNRCMIETTSETDAEKLYQIINQLIIAYRK